MTAWDQVVELLSSPLMQRALIAAILVGAAAPVVGTFLVQRRMALLGDGIGHVALTGVALGWLVGSWAGLVPQDALAVPGAVIAAIVGSVVIELVRERGRTSGDLALALMFYGGIAGGVLLIKVAGGTNANLISYLFGSISTVSTDRPVVDRRARRPRARRRRRPADRPVRRQPRRGVRPRQRAAGAAAVDARRDHRRPHRHHRDARRRPAAGQRADDRAGGDRAAVRPLVQPDHDAGQRHRRRRQRRRAGAHVLAGHPARRHDRRPRDRASTRVAATLRPLLRRARSRRRTRTRTWSTTCCWSTTCDDDLDG